jgi:hypothetical protein
MTTERSNELGHVESDDRDRASLWLPRVPISPSGLFEGVVLKTLSRRAIKTIATNDQKSGRAARRVIAPPCWTSHFGAAVLAGLATISTKKWSIRHLGVGWAAQYKRKPKPVDALPNREFVRASMGQIGFDLIRLDQPRFACEDVLQGSAG